MVFDNHIRMIVYKLYYRETHNVEIYLRSLMHNNCLIKFVFTLSALAHRNNSSRVRYNLVLLCMNLYKSNVPMVFIYYKQ